MVSRLVALLVAAGIGIIIFGGVTGIQGQLTPYAGLISLLIASFRFMSDRDKEKRKRRDIVEQSIRPTISPLITVLKTAKLGDVSSEQIDDLERSAEKDVHGESDLIPTIVHISNKFADTLKVVDKYKRAYSLALAYKLVLSKDIKEGQTAREIDSAVTKRKIIKCGKDTWNLSDDDVAWYLKFSESEELLELQFSQIYTTVKDLDVKKLQEQRDEVHREAQVLRTYLKDKDVRFQRLMMLIMKRIPHVDFLKIMVSLRTDIVLISLIGVSDPSDRGSSGGAETGSKYIKQVLEELKLNFGKLNRSVYFGFLKDVVPKGTDSRYFDLQSWGKQIEIRANELRKEDNGHERKFNFVVLKSSLHELRSFGDKLEDESRIKISSEMLDNIGSGDANLSTLITISKILRELESTSLRDFIDKNLEYVEGINDQDAARKISQHLMKKHNKQDWLISDFKKCTIKKEDLTELGIDEEQAVNILKESTSIAEILSSMG